LNILFDLLPAFIVAMYGGLLATWAHLANRPNSHIEKWAMRISWSVLVLYFAWLLLLTVYQRQIPFINVGQLAAFIGFLIWASHLYAQSRIRQGILAVLPILAAAALVMISLVMGAEPVEIPGILKGYWVSIHITLAMAGVALLLGAGVYGFGYLILHRQIKRRSFGPFFSMMPSLNDLNRLRSVTVTSGWIFVTIGVIGGVIWMLINSNLYRAFSSHLGIAVVFWVVVSLMAAASRFRWLGQHRLAGFSALISALMIILIMMSIAVTYPEILK
jgi:ABC-type uncharacterized transport system permease subunit